MEVVPVSKVHDVVAGTYRLLCHGSQLFVEIGLLPDACVARFCVLCE